MSVYITETDRGTITPYLSPKIFLKGITFMLDTNTCPGGDGGGCGVYVEKKLQCRKWHSTFRIPGMCWQEWNCICTGTELETPVTMQYMVSRYCIPSIAANTSPYRFSPHFRDCSSNPIPSHLPIRWLPELPLVLASSCLISAMLSPNFVVVCKYPVIILTDTSPRNYLMYLYNLCRSKNNSSMAVNWQVLLE